MPSPKLAKWRSTASDSKTSTKRFLPPSSSCSQGISDGSQNASPTTAPRPPANAASARSPARSTKTTSANDRPRTTVPSMPAAHGSLPANTNPAQPSAPRMNATVAFEVNIDASRPTPQNSAPMSQ